MKYKDGIGRPVQQDREGNALWEIQIGYQNGEMYKSLYQGDYDDAESWGLDLCDEQQANGKLIDAFEIVRFQP